MRTAHYFFPLVAAVAALGFAACSSSTATLPSLYNDSTVTVDIATNAGDAAALAIQTMQDNETQAGATADFAGSSALFAATNTPNVVRTRTCYDANGVVVAGCTPIASVRKIVTHATIDGTRNGSSTTTGGTTATWTGAIHRVSNDTVTRNFNTATPSVETSRTHSDLVTGHDTTTFTDAALTRNVTETTTDSVKKVTWNLPRTANPYPVSGTIIRVDAVHVALTKGTQSETKDLVRTVEVDFPADAQGNVVLKVNAKTCNLNLVTHVVSGCQ